MQNISHMPVFTSMSFSICGFLDNWEIPSKFHFSLFWGNNQEVVSSSPLGRGLTKMAEKDK